MTRASLKEIASCPLPPSLSPSSFSLLPPPLGVAGCHLSYISRRYSASISCHRCWLPFNPPAGSRSASVLAAVQARRWLCYVLGRAGEGVKEREGRGGNVARFQQKVPLSPLPSTPAALYFQFQHPR